MNTNRFANDNRLLDRADDIFDAYPLTASMMLFIVGLSAGLVAALLTPSPRQNISTANTGRYGRHILNGLRSMAPRSWT